MFADKRHFPYDLASIKNAAADTARSAHQSEDCEEHNQIRSSKAHSVFEQTLLPRLGEITFKPCP